MNEQHKRTAPRFTALTLLRNIGTVLGAGIMGVIITGCIVACVLTVYILKSMGSEEPVNLESIKLGYTSIIMAYDKDGNEVELQRLYDTDNNRIPIDWEDINEYTRDALVSIEDKRFYDHQGVDWVRTTGAFLNQFVPVLSGGNQGGSTIHQQLIKNVTGDNAPRIDRKVREIFRALNLAKQYSHEQVLEAYLNVVPFGAGASGIQAAANVYFGKDAKDLTLAEAAAIVGITQKPTAYNPLLYPEENKKRQTQVLDAMLEQERITQAEYDNALTEELHFSGNLSFEQTYMPNSYFVDYVIDSIIVEFMNKYNMSEQEASRELFTGGYRIYTTVNMEEQKRLETFFEDVNNFPPVILSTNSEYPQSNAVITDTNGKIIAMVGGRGKKTESRSFNRATSAKRQPGSTFKVIGPYALAFEYNLITPSTIIEDSPINPSGPGEPYPRNYYGSYVGPITVEKAIYNSVNTVAVKVTQRVTPASLFDHYYYDLNITSLENPTDIDISPMALGGVTHGVTTLELVGAYQIAVNGGTYTPPYAFTKVVDSSGKVVLKPDTEPRTVLSEDTAVLLNKMTQKVVQVGTGTTAQLPNGMPTGGKTGTSNDDIDQWFIGFSPYYIAGVWLGYDQPNTFDRQGNRIKNSVLYYNYPPPILWRSIMTPLHEDLEAIPFIDSPGVVSGTYCTITGNLAVEGCPTATTFYKSSNMPPRCSGVHATAKDKKDDKKGSKSSTNKNSQPTTDIEMEQILADE